MIPNKLLPDNRELSYTIIKVKFYVVGYMMMRCMVSCQRPPSKCHTNYWNHTPKNVLFTDWFFCVIHALWSVTGCTIYCHPFPTHVLTWTSKWLIELHNATDELIKNIPCQNVTRFWFCTFNIITKLAFARVLYIYRNDIKMLRLTSHISQLCL